MRGRKPIPTPLKILAGNPGKRPLPDREPMPKRGRPKCPAHLHDYAKEEWSRLLPELDRLGLLTMVDRAALSVYCQAWAEHRLAVETLNADGRYVTRGTGGLGAHPALAQLHAAEATIAKFASLFGLDPSSRSRLSVPDQHEDELSAFLAPKQEQQ
jgi:P27 family predicted phage terminase small subunit